MPLLAPVMMKVLPSRSMPGGRGVTSGWEKTFIVRKIVAGQLRGADAGK